MLTTEDFAIYFVKKEIYLCSPGYRYIPTTYARYLAAAESRSGFALDLADFQWFGHHVNGKLVLCHGLAELLLSVLKKDPHMQQCLPYFINEVERYIRSMDIQSISSEYRFFILEIFQPSRLSVEQMSVVNTFKRVLQRAAVQVQSQDVVYPALYLLGSRDKTTTPLEEPMQYPPLMTLPSASIDERQEDDDLRKSAVNTY